MNNYTNSTITTRTDDDVVTYVFVGLISFVIFCCIIDCIRELRKP